METTVDKLEAMFQKSEADLEYIEKRLKLDFISKVAENGCPEENPAEILENLMAIKAKHTALCCQVKELAAAQKESMDSIRNHLNSTMELIKHFQQTTDVEIEPLTESEQGSAELLCSAATSSTPREVTSAVACCVQQQQTLSSEYEELSESTFDSVPLNMRSNVKLSDLNAFYRQLQQHSKKTNSFVSVQKMKELNIKVSEAKLKVLQHLSLIELDRKGHVRLVM
ncbi:SKA complex subunit 2 [Sphaeramia orbicularis]|uniref:SKA complex subunit 2 n=1 Tax=Sphaeramia orbicularis TaxID=375764 RepID=UPI00117CCC04|nr:spindle and kinetochore-associated protein 2 [Sphaeramia orbicularis]